MQDDISSAESPGLLLDDLLQPRWRNFARGYSRRKFDSRYQVFHSNLTNASASWLKSKKLDVEPSAFNLILPYYSPIGSLREPRLLLYHFLLQSAKACHIQYLNTQDLWVPSCLCPGWNLFPSSTSIEITFPWSVSWRFWLSSQVRDLCVCAIHTKAPDASATIDAPFPLQCCILGVFFILMNLLIVWQGGNIG